MSGFPKMAKGFDHLFRAPTGNPSGTPQVDVAPGLNEDGSESSEEVELPAVTWCSVFSRCFERDLMFMAIYLDLPRGAN